MIEPSRRHGHFDPRFSIQRAPAGTPDIDELPGGLDWAAFSGRLFPGRRSHDFEVLKAYEAYKDDSRGPAGEPARKPARDREAALFPVGAE